MKEAAGEANMTVITIVLIAIVLAAGTLIVTNMMNSMKGNEQTRCAEQGGAWNGTACIGSDGNEINIGGQEAETQPQ